MTPAPREARNVRYLWASLQIVAWKLYSCGEGFMNKDMRRAFFHGEPRICEKQKPDPAVMGFDAGPKAEQVMSREKSVLEARGEARRWLP